MRRHLKEHLLNINEQYFNFPENKLPYILWGKGKVKKGINGLCWAVYDCEKNTLTVHPIFKNEEIDLRFLKFVIYHELLHFEDDIINKKKYSTSTVFGKKALIYHDEHFRYRESKFENFEFIKFPPHDYENFIFNKIYRGMLKIPTE